MNAMKTKIEAAVDRVLPKVIALRHALHQKPELAGNESATAARIRDALRATKIELLPPFLGTDVVGLLRGRRKGRNVALRADIYALPMQ